MPIPHQRRNLLRICSCFVDHKRGGAVLRAAATGLTGLASPSPRVFSWRRGARAAPRGQPRGIVGFMSACAYRVLVNHRLGVGPCQREPYAFAPDPRPCRSPDTGYWRWLPRTDPLRIHAMLCRRPRHLLARGAAARRDARRRSSSAVAAWTARSRGRSTSTIAPISRTAWTRTSSSIRLPASRSWSIEVL